MFENPARTGRQARNFTTNVPKILDLKSSSEQIFSENCRWAPLKLGLTVVRNIYGLLKFRYIEIYIFRFPENPIKQVSTDIDY